MAQPYVGELRMFAGNFAPNGWEFCNGQVLPISENETLFQLIGTTYGGDGEETFGLPNLQTRIPLHMGTGPDGITYPLAQMAGTEQETLTLQQTPIHTHVLQASATTASSRDPGGLTPAIASGDLYNGVLDPVTLNAQTVLPTGASQPHENVQPFLCINYIISMFGIFPSQT